MSLNIKNPEAHTLAHQLADLTGESITQAVMEAVRERLERVRRDRQDRREKLSRIAKECAAHFREPFLSVDHGDLLYDEKGLPK